MELEEIPGKLNRTSKSKGKKKRSYVRQGVFPQHTETARLGQGLYSSAAKSIPSPYPCLLSPHIIQCYCEIFLKSINLQAGVRGRFALHGDGEECLEQSRGFLVPALQQGMLV